MSRHHGRQRSVACCAALWLEQWLHILTECVGELNKGELTVYPEVPKAVTCDAICCALLRIASLVMFKMIWAQFPRDDDLR